MTEPAYAIELREPRVHARRRRRAPAPLPHERRPCRSSPGGRMRTCRPRSSRSRSTGQQALVITGSGDSFMDQIDGPSLGEIFKPAVWEKIRVEGAKVLHGCSSCRCRSSASRTGRRPSTRNTCSSRTSTSPPSGRRTATSPIRPSASPAGTGCTSSGRRSPARLARNGCSDGRADRRADRAAVGRRQRSSAARARARAGIEIAASSPRSRRSTGRCKNRRST